MSAAVEPAAVRDVVGEVLGVDLAGEENPRRETVESWDSLVHLEVVFVLEEEFDVRFSETEITEMDSVAAIVAVIQAKHAS